jgi:hypothetical protein
MITRIFKTILFIGIVIVSLPIILILYVADGIHEMFKDKSKPMTKEEYYGPLR